MKCPVCETELKLSQRAGVEIDYCPVCLGVWLDRSEMDQIIERSSRDFESHRQDRLRDRDRARDSDRDDDRHSDRQNSSQPSQKRESFWRELFDFG